MRMPPPTSNGRSSRPRTASAMTTPMRSQCDRLGRIWAGQLNHGIAVFNGETWKVYDVPYGPIAERVFTIATSPIDGDVWIGTSAGLTRYSLRGDMWIHYTRGSGLPADQVCALAFDRA